MSHAPLHIDWPRSPDQAGPADPARIKASLDKARDALAELPTSRIVEALNDLSDSLLRPGNPLPTAYPASGLPFLARILRTDNLQAMLADSFDTPACLDKYMRHPGAPDRERRAYPRGLVVHWLAGNVPTLGLLSLISAMLTKNASMVRVPKAADGMLGDLLEHLHGLGGPHSLLASAVAVLRYEHQDMDTAQAVSGLADARIIWGGDESTKAVKKLPCKTTCVDLVFPDRTSFAVVARSHSAGKAAASTARLLAHDISVFEQKACASPHTVFVAVRREEEIKDFCQILVRELGNVLTAMPKTPPSAREASAILNLRSQYDMFHEAWHPTGLEFSVLHDDKVQLGPPIGNRTVYVRKLPDEQALAEIIPANIQSVGLAADRDEIEGLTELLGKAGVHRFTPLGAMCHFELPWDGIQIPQYLVRWTSRRCRRGSAT